MNSPFLKHALIFLMAISLPLLSMPQPSAQEDTQAANNSDDAALDMIVGDIQTVTVNKLSRVSVTNPDVADISDAQNDKVSVLAKTAGDAVLFLWDANGKRSINIRVAKEDLQEVKARIESILKEAGISGLDIDANPEAGKVVVSGALNRDDKFRLANILQTYPDTVLNLVKEEKNEDLIQVDMQIVEISTSLEKDLGVLWNTSASASTTSGTSSTSSSGTNSGLVTESEKIPSTNGDGKIGDFFKVGSFSRTPLQATINAFIQEGKARLISKPRLVAMSGKQASFLVGGEIPIETTTTNTTGSTLTQNTSYTQYGVNVTVTPTIREGKIDILLNVDIRDIDASNSSNGNVAFITRTATTNLFMEDKQTIALAGLIKYTDNEQVTRVPFLSNIPLLGALFRNRNTPTPDTKTEMVIVLTPMVLTERHFEHDQVIMPTPSERSSWNEVITAKYEKGPMPNWPLTQKAGEAQDNPEVLPVMTAYARGVQEKISRSILYPAGGDVAGTVKLKLHILRDGSLDSEEVTESSGNDTLDQDAMQAAKTAAPFEAFSTGMDQEGVFFTIPIVYNRIAPNQAPPEKVIASY